jgi:lipopolysaccharide/colanic/teichoic acid biosynthesis glycosyltransferase
VLVALAVLLAAHVLDPGRRLAQLLPLASLVTRALVPIAGLALAWAVALPFKPLPIADLVPAALGGMLVLLLGAWLLNRFEHRVEIRIAVAGPPQVARMLRRELALTGLPGYRVVGWVDGGAPDNIPELRRLGTFAQIAAIVDREGIDLIVNVGGDQMAVAKVVAEECLALDVRLSTVSQLQEEILGQISLETMDSSYFQYLMHPNFRGGSLLVKRVVDVALSSLALLVTGPLLALGALATKLSGGDAILVGEPRVGVAGTRFEMLKLRTGESALGALLRRTHVDELPQLWNVLRGEMSLVGPRPELPERIAELEAQLPLYDRRLLVAPGLTGWAQIRNAEAIGDADSAWKLSQDLYYLKHRSTALDAMILLQTLVVAAHGFRLPEQAADESLAHAN